MSPIRHCSRGACKNAAVATMTYDYKQATAVLGPLSPVPLPGAFDLCSQHAHTVTVPVGWQMIRLKTEFEPVPPSTDDLTALADAIREASRKDVPPPQPAQREIRRTSMDISATPRPRSRPHFTVVDGGNDTVDGADGQSDLTPVSDE
ncbi:DUF3499 domain-containing protein [Arcanobacterium phocae]|uniref:DUF3499 domain-containing protein n=2 Tax=Arcanobacterium phocae TaxID=131112 RepID=UPI001C0E9F74|nr:DUF3499 domain-containing protein [Arcanobacterium phocae]